MFVDLLMKILHTDKNLDVTSVNVVMELMIWSSCEIQYQYKTMVSNRFNRFVICTLLNLCAMFKEYCSPIKKLVTLLC